MMTYIFIPYSQEHSVFIGYLSEDVDDYALYLAFKNKYNSVKAAKGMSGHC